MRRFRILCREFVRLAAREGTLTAVVFSPLLVWRRLRDFDVEPWARADPAGEQFDEQYGVDTCGVVPMAHLAVSDTNWVHGFGYQAILSDEIEALLPELDVDYQNTVFIDLGAGKGRALMLASMFSFKRIIGVEIAPELADIARTNLRAFASKHHHYTAIEIICADASSYRLPADPLVLYLYNPFGVPVMQKVIANVIESLRLRPRPVVVIYFRPELAEMWDPVPGFILTKSSARFRVYDNRSMLDDPTPSILA